MKVKEEMTKIFRAIFKSLEPKCIVCNSSDGPLYEDIDGSILCDNHK